MWVSEFTKGGLNILLAAFTVYLFFLYFSIFFHKRQEKYRKVIGILAVTIWLLGIPEVINILPLGLKLSIAVAVMMFGAMNIFIGKVWEMLFFIITFAAIWMMAETLAGNVLLIYYEPLADSILVGSLISKFLLFLVLFALKKVFTKVELSKLSASHSVLLILIPIGSIYVMDTVFMLAYQLKNRHAEMTSLISSMILLFMNILVFYIYIKLADDLQIRKMNIVYEQQLELCERHQKEIEISMIKIREIKHNMKNNFIAILSYAKKGDCDKLIKYIDDIMDEGKFLSSVVRPTGNIVIDSIVDYWQRTAEAEDIKFYSNLCIPMDIPFKGADLCLILGNLLENAVEATRKVEQRKYIRLMIKYDRDNLLIAVENSYKERLIKGSGTDLATTKSDVENHGIGLSSVRRTVGRYHGTVFIDDSIPERFLIRIVLYESRLLKNQKEKLHE